jgi:hypothetical protein
MYQFVIVLLLFDLHTVTEPGFSIRRTVSSVIGSISGLILLASSSDPRTWSRWILISVIV